MMEAGIVGTLKRLCEWSGHGYGGGGTTSAGWNGPTFISSNTGGGGGNGGVGARSPGRLSGAGGTGASGGGGGSGSWGGSGSMRHIHGSGHSSLGMDEDRFVIQSARVALDWLEHGEGYV